MKTILFYTTVLSFMLHIILIDSIPFMAMLLWGLTNCTLFLVCGKLMSLRDLYKASGYKQFMKLIHH